MLIAIYRYFVFFFLLCTMIAYSAEHDTVPLIGGGSSGVHHLTIVGTPISDDEAEQRLFRETPNLLHQAFQNNSFGGFHRLINQPSVQAVENAVSQLVNNDLEGGDIVIAIYAHGIVNSSNAGLDEVYDEWIHISAGRDGIPNNDDDVYLSDDELGSIVNDIPERFNVTIIMNTCYGGGFTGGIDDVESSERVHLIGPTGSCAADDLPGDRSSSIFRQLATMLDQSVAPLSSEDVATRLTNAGLLNTPLGDTDDIAIAANNLMKIWYIAHGHTGDSTLIRFPNGKFILIDGGFADSYPHVRRVLDDNNVEELELVIATHGDSDHLNGLTRLINDAHHNDEITINDIWINNNPNRSTAYQTLIEVADAEDIEVTSVFEGQTIDFHNNRSITAQILSPPRIPFSNPNENITRNSNSIILEIQYRNMKFLFTSDATHITEQYLLENYENVEQTVLNAPHHGSRHSSTGDFVDGTSPELVIYTAKRGDPHHPHPETKRRWEAVDNIRTLQTGTTGTIRVETEGNFCTVFHRGTSGKSCGKNIRSLAPHTFSYEAPDIKIDNRIEFKTDIGDPTILNQYDKRRSGPVTFNIYTYVQRNSIKNVSLEISAYDIDRESSNDHPPSCAPGEIAIVYLNDQEIGALDGGNNEHAITRFELSKNTVEWAGSYDSPGENQLEIRLHSDTPEECQWAFQINWGRISGEQMPMVFIPGIMGTELYHSDYSHLIPRHFKIWPSWTVNTEMLNLELNREGTAPRTRSWQFRVGKIIRKVYRVYEVYENVLDHYLPSQGYYSEENFEKVEAALNSKNPDYLRTTPLPDTNFRLFEYAYDWRYDNRVTARNLGTLVDEIREDVDSKVMLVAHSMGGLVSRYYLLHEGGADKTQMLFTMGTPYKGAPNAYKVMRFGEDLFKMEWIAEAWRKRDHPEIAVLFDIVAAMDRYAVKRVARASPAINQLLPSDRYWREYSPVTYRHGFRNNHTITSNSEEAYRTVRRTRVSWAHRIADAQAFHRELNRPFPSAVDVYINVGINQTNVNRVTVNRLTDSPQFTLENGEGDGTVPLISARLDTGDGYDEMREYDVLHVPMPNHGQVQANLRGHIRRYHDDGSREIPEYGIPELIDPPTIEESKRCGEYPEVDPIPGRRLENPRPNGCVDDDRGVIILTPEELERLLNDNN